MPQLNTLGAIKYKMDEQGIKPKDLESIIGSKGQVSSILAGRRVLTLKIAEQLCALLQLPPTVFFKHCNIKKPLKASANKGLQV